MLSVFGLAYVQYQYLRVGLNLAKVQFDEKVEKATLGIKNGLRTENELTYLLVSGMHRQTNFFKTHADSVLNASRYFLNDFLKENLVANGIEANFSYNLMTRDSAYYLKSPLIQERSSGGIQFPIVLEGYIPKTFEHRFILNLQFQDLNRYFLSQLSGLTVPSILFLIGIIGVVLWALRTYYWQRKMITTTDAFINNLTHELKTPVFSIRLASKMLEDKVNLKEKRFLEIIRQQAERLSNHIEKVLELATMERKRAIIQKEVLNFFPVLERTCTDFKTLVALEEVEFIYDLSGDEYFILGEAFHLQNMVNNLLDNAKKYAEYPKIELKAFVQQKKLKIEIQDNGRGISKTEQKKVFDKFYRTTNGNTHNVKGFGLGLHYVKTVVEQHKGNIHLASEINIGTKVTIDMPLYERGQ